MSRKATRKWSGRSVELAKIHMAAKDRQLLDDFDDSAYRDMLWAVARVRSAKDLDAMGRARVLAHLRAMGWVDPSPPRRARINEARVGKPQVERIRALWSALDLAGALREPGESGLRAYVRKQSAPYHPDRVGYDAPELLPPRVAQRVIEHLKKWCGRVGAELPA